MRQQVSPQNAILTAEQIWGTDLSAYDPDGPLPDIDPVPDSEITRGRVRHGDPISIVARWRALAEAKGLSLRQTVIETTTRQSFIGSPRTVAAELTAFVDRVVPLLQESGAFRSEYTGSTLRSHLGLPEPVWKG